MNTKMRIGADDLRALTCEHGNHMDHCPCNRAAVKDSLTPQHAKASEPVSKRHRECARELNLYGVNRVEIEPSAKILAKHFPDQSAELSELRDRNSWLEGQREIAIKEKTDADSAWREKDAELEKLQKREKGLENEGLEAVRLLRLSEERVKALEEGVNKAMILIDHFSGIMGPKWIRESSSELKDELAKLLQPAKERP